MLKLFTSNFHILTQVYVTVTTIYAIFKTKSPFEDVLNIPYTKYYSFQTCLWGPELYNFRPIIPKDLLPIHRVLPWLKCDL